MVIEANRCHRCQGWSGTEQNKIIGIEIKEKCDIIAHYINCTDSSMLRWPFSAIYCSSPLLRPPHSLGPLALALSYKSPKKYICLHRHYFDMSTKFLGNCTMYICASCQIQLKVACSIASLALQQVSSSVLHVYCAYQIDTRCIHHIEIDYVFRSCHTQLI